MATEERLAQHRPKHLDGEVFDPRHPAASAFAPAQPGAGVVADDVEEKGQNLAGGPTAEQASAQYSDQKEVLAKRHEENLRVAVPTPPARKGAEPEPKSAKAPAAENDGESSSAARKSSDSK